MDIAAIREGLAANLRATNVNIAISSYMQDTQIGPLIEIYPEKSIFDEGFETDELRFKVRAVVGNTLSIAAQQTLDLLLAPTGGASVKELIEAEPTLGGIVNDLRVSESTGYRLYPSQGQGHVLGCEWTVCIYPIR